MKKSNILNLLLFVFLTVQLVSCSDDDKVDITKLKGPSIEVLDMEDYELEEEIILNRGTALDFKCTALAGESELKTFEIKVNDKVVFSTPEGKFKDKVVLEKHSLTFNLQGNYEVTLLVTDVTDKEAKFDFIVKVGNEPFIKLMEKEGYATTDITIMENKCVKLSWLANITGHKYDGFTISVFPYKNQNWESYPDKRPDYSAENLPETGDFKGEWTSEPFQKMGEYAIILHVFDDDEHEVTHPDGFTYTDCNNTALILKVTVEDNPDVTALSEDLFEIKATKGQYNFKEFNDLNLGIHIRSDFSFVKEGADKMVQLSSEDEDAFANIIFKEELKKMVDQGTDLEKFDKHVPVKEGWYGYLLGIKKGDDYIVAEIGVVNENYPEEGFSNLEISYKK